MKKRFTAMLLTVLMLVAIAVPVAQAATDVPYETRYLPTVAESLQDEYYAFAGKFSKTSYMYNVVTEKNTVGYNHFEIVENDDGSVSVISPENGTADDGVLCSGRSSTAFVSTTGVADLGTRGTAYDANTNPGYSVSFKVDNDEAFYSEKWGASLSVCFTENQIKALPGQYDYNETTGEINDTTTGVTLNSVGTNGLRGAGSAQNEANQIVKSNAGIYIVFLMGENSGNEAPHFIYIIRDDGKYVNHGKSVHLDDNYGMRWSYLNRDFYGNPIVKSLREENTVEIRPDATHGYAIFINGVEITALTAGEHDGSSSTSTYGDDHTLDRKNHPLDASDSIDFLNKFNMLDNGAHVTVGVTGGSGSGSAYKCDFTVTSLDGGKASAGAHEHAISDEWITPEVTYPCLDYEEYKGCTICGKAVETRTVKATAEHNWSDWEASGDAPACVSHEESRTCSVCGTKETRTVKPTEDHDWSEYFEVSAATLASEGLMATVCNNLCGTYETDVIEKMKNDGTIDKYTDIIAGSWYVNGMAYGLQKGIINGTSATTASPTGVATRAQFVQMLYNLAGKPDVSDLKNNFTDVVEGKWYYNAVIWAAHNGITSGTSATTFSPNLSVTREQLVKLIYGYATNVDQVVNGIAIEYPEVTETLNGFTDKSTVSSWATENVKWGVQFKLISGTTATTLSPKKTATRAEVVTMLQNYAHSTKAAAIANTFGIKIDA